MARQNHAEARMIVMVPLGVAAEDSILSPAAAGLSLSVRIWFVVPAPAPKSPSVIIREIRVNRLLWLRHPRKPTLYRGVCPFHNIFVDPGGSRA